MVRRLIHIALLALLYASAFSQPSKVHVITVDGAINPPSSDYIESSIKRAVAENAECLVIRLNTPGGLLKSTRVIVSEILQSRIPIVVYVAPGGSQAASAGVFVTMAAHVAAMSPGTNIGAAHPVSLQGEQDSVMMEKATNDAAAFIRTISEKRHRNVQWAEDAVRKSLSITESEALKENVIDLVAENLSDLMEKIDGREVETVTGKKVLRTKGAEIVMVDMSFRQKLLGVFSDPNLAYILLMLGIYGLLFELYNPGSILPGVVGGICLILAFYSLHTLPVNYAGLALIIFGIILFILEIKVTSYGLLSIGGTVALVLGSIMLIDTAPGLEFLEISWPVILFVVLFTLAFFLIAIGLGLRAQRRKPTTGMEGMVGEVGEAITNLKPDGRVRVHGETWSAETLDGTIRAGTKIVVAGTSNLKLKVKKATQ